MRFSTASLILAYVAALAVQAAPIDDSNGGLSLRSADLVSAPVVRSADSGFELDAREPKDKKGKKYKGKDKKKAAARDEDGLSERSVEIEEREAVAELDAREPKKTKKGKKGKGKGEKKVATRDEDEFEIEEREADAEELEAREPKKDDKKDKKKDKKKGKKGKATATATAAATAATATA